MTSTMPFVHQLRPLPSVDDDLMWFFNSSESAMGAISNFEATLGRSSAAIPHSPEDAAEASHRQRRIRRWLKVIPDSDAGVLQAAYELRDWPVALFDQLGRLTGIVVRMACALDMPLHEGATRRLIETARARWLASFGDALGYDSSLVRLRREAELRYVRAHHAYGLVRGLSARRLP